MGTPYKRQHYLPAGYLKYFAIQAAQIGRESWIWRCDGKTQQRVRVDSQCAGSFHYSKIDAVAVEAVFSTVESKYCGCLDKIVNGIELSEQELGGLLFAMFDFYIRNAVHKNLTGKEEIQAYRRRSNIFIRQILLKSEGEITKEDILQHVLRYWRVEVVSTPAGLLLMTSDNPSTWMSVNTSVPGLHLLALPITPHKVAVAFDIRYFNHATKQMSEEDYFTLIDSQLQNAVSSIYTPNPLSDDNLNAIKDKFPNKEKRECQVDETSWRVTMWRLPEEFHFSFLHK